MTNSSNLRIIRGGRRSPAYQIPMKFVSCTATDTRLMGVVGIHITWKTTGGGYNERFEQLFYLNFEDNIIDPYFESGDSLDIRMAREKILMLSALGGNAVDLSEKEVRFLVQSCCLTPAGRTKQNTGSGYDNLLQPAAKLRKTEYDDLMKRICTPLPTPLYYVNYYLMRAASMDLRGMAYLTGQSLCGTEMISPSDMPDDLPPFPYASKGHITLCLNTIESQLDGNRYLCRALTERPDSYYLSSIELSLESNTGRVRGASLISEFRISDIEAAMILRRTEYIDVFKVIDDDPRFNAIFRSFTTGFTENIYEHGRLFIEYNNNNDHVGKAEYRLNDDVKTAYYLSDRGQLLMMAYTPEAAKEAEYHLSQQFSSFGIIFGMKFEFPDPVLYEFINSDFDDFLDFILFITGPEK